jgi:hypothetical protein
LVEIRLQFSQSAPGPTSVDSARDIVLVRSKIRNNSAITPKKGLNLYRLNSAKNTTTIRPVTPDPFDFCNRRELSCVPLSAFPRFGNRKAQHLPKGSKVKARDYSHQNVEQLNYTRSIANHFVIYLKFSKP